MEQFYGLFGLGFLICVWKVLFRSWRQTHSPTIRQEMRDVAKQVKRIKRTGK